MNIFRAVLALLCIIALQAVIAAPVVNCDTSDGISDTDSELSDAETLVDEGDAPDDIGGCKAETIVQNLKKNISQFNKCPHITTMDHAKLDALIMDLPPSSWKGAHARCSNKKGLKNAAPDSDAYCQCLAKQISKQLRCSSPQCAINEMQAKAARRAEKKVKRKAKKAAAKEREKAASSSHKK
ncbi:hypothetical protein F5887DRAFT_1076114 [Amanita rubescens]|nr:hypothetical protein F5887DRAFT_1076114 [Amanita rubescens]